MKPLKSYYKIQKCKGCKKKTKFYYYLGKRKSPYCNECLKKKQNYCKTLPCSKCKKPTRFKFINGFRKSRFCKACQAVKQKEKEQKHKQTKTYQQKRIKSLHDKAWKLMSKIVRLAYSIDGKYCRCFTCNKLISIKETHAGHYHHGGLDFDMRNLKPQDAKCNTYQGGRLDIYGTKLAQMHGAEWMQKLLRDYHTEKRRDVKDYEELIVKLQKQLTELESKKYL